MRSRWQTTALVISVGLNVFMIGVALADLARRSQEHPTAGSQRLAMNAAGSSLSPEDRARFLNLLRSEGLAVQPENRLARRLRDDAWASLGAASFDASNAKAKLAQARGINIRSRMVVESAVIDFAAGLPLHERVALGAAMRRFLHHQHLEGAAEPSR